MSTGQSWQHVGVLSENKRSAIGNGLAACAVILFFLPSIQIRNDNFSNALLFWMIKFTIIAILAAVALRLLSKPEQRESRLGSLLIRIKRALLIGLACGCVLAVALWSVFIIRAIASSQKRQQEVRQSSSASCGQDMRPVLMANCLSTSRCNI